MVDLIFEYRALFQYAAILFLGIAAILRGSVPEKMCAAILVAMPVMDMAYHQVFAMPVIVSTTDIGHLLMDALAAAAFFAIALQANRKYPIWLTAFQLVSVLSHVVRDISEGVGGTAYQIMVIAPSYCMIAILSAGLLAHRRRIRKYGPYRDWRTS